MGRSFLINAIALFSFAFLAFNGFARGVNQLEYAVIADGGDWNSNSRSVRDSISRYQIPNLILPGDNLYDPESTYEKAWGPWLEENFLFSIVAIGNRRGKYKDEVDFFKMPGEYYELRPTPEVSFLVLNSDHNSTAQEQADWFQKQLQETQASSVFVVFHHPSFTIHSKHSWEERRDFHEKVRPLLFQYRKKITAVLVGHEHIASLILFDDLPVIVSGAVKGTTAPEWIDNEQEGHSIRSIWMYNQTPHWTRLVIDPQLATSKVEFIKAKDDTVSFCVNLKTGHFDRAEEILNCL